MAVFSYNTIKQPAAGSYREKGSKFLAFAYPVRSEADIKACLKSLRDQYFDARHHCYAWILGPDKKLFRANDDGEPNHSAGDPILGQLRSKDLTDALIVVVRYFGGVKLGVGGLTAAYRAASEDAIAHATIIEKEVTVRYHLQYDYAATAEVMRLVKTYNLQFDEPSFGDTCTTDLKVALRIEEAFLKKGL